MQGKVQVVNDFLSWLPVHKNVGNITFRYVIISMLRTIEKLAF